MKGQQNEGTIGRTCNTSQVYSIEEGEQKIKNLNKRMKDNPQNSIKQTYYRSGAWGYCPQQEYMYNNQDRTQSGGKTC